LGKLLAQFLVLFADCFRYSTGRRLLAVDVRGLLSDVQRKNVEAMALAQGVAVRTLQRFLESIAWGEELLRDRCQQFVSRESAGVLATCCSTSRSRVSLAVIWARDFGDSSK
jgi:hypothetical protein